MAYTPIEWATGDIITAEKLNSMQHGAVIVDPEATTYTEVKALFDAGNVVLLSYGESESGVSTYLMTGYSYDADGFAPKCRVYFAQQADDQLPNNSYYGAETPADTLVLQIPD